MLISADSLFTKYNKSYKFSRDEILSILEQECRLFESIINEVKPDFLAIKTTDWHQNHLFYLLDILQIQTYSVFLVKYHHPILLLQSFLFH